jgi:hypothetical protein
MDRADLVLVGAVDPIISHGDQGDLIWQCGKHGPNGRIRGDERGCVKPLGAVCRDDDPLGPGARPLDNRFTLEIDLGDLERRIPEVNPGGARPDTSPIQTCPVPAPRSASASSTVATIMMRDAPLARATAAVVKARNTSIIPTVPFPRAAPSSKL